MGIPVLILGESGSGKSTSMRNFEPGEIQIFNVASKPFPFRKKLDKVDNANYKSICQEIQQGKYKRYVIDDSQYLLCFEMFAHAKDTGYQKFTDMALNFYKLIRYIIDGTPADTIVYMLHHTELTADGKSKAKTIGKMLDEKLTVEGLFSIVLRAVADGDRYYFETQTDGADTVKSPMEMFDKKEIDNDLKAVDNAIREYWDLQK